MKYKSLILILLMIGSIIIFIQCDNNLVISDTLNEVPVVSGIIKTTKADPEGKNNIILGDPGYPMPNSLYSDIFVFPNPYIISNWTGQIKYYEHFISFRNVPAKTKILIYKAISNVEKKGLLSNNTNLLKPQKIASLYKDSDSHYFEYDLKDENGDYINSGFYRAYFYSDDNKLLNYLDLYIILPYDCENFIDFPGWAESSDSLCEKYKDFVPDRF